MLRSSLLRSLLFAFKEPLLLLPEESRSLGLPSFSEDELPFLDPPDGVRRWVDFAEPSLGTSRVVGGGREESLTEGAESDCTLEVVERASSKTESSTASSKFTSS